MSVSTFENVANTLSVGSDLNLNVRKGPLQLNSTGSVSRYSSDASNLSHNLSTHDIVKSARAVYLTISRNFGHGLRIKPKSDPDVPQQGPPSG